MRNEYYYVYILTNNRNTVLYVGVTGDIVRRLQQHREGCGSQFVKKYNAYKLIYFEMYTDPENALKREKQLKAGSRKKKTDIIVSRNPAWKDISQEIL